MTIVPSAVFGRTADLEIMTFGHIYAKQELGGFGISSGCQPTEDDPNRHAAAPPPSHKSVIEA